MAFFDCKLVKIGSYASGGISAEQILRQKLCK